MAIRMSDTNDLFYTNHLLNLIFLFILYSYFIFGFAFAEFLLYSILYLIIPKKKYYDFVFGDLAIYIPAFTVTRIEAGVELVA